MSTSESRAVTMMIGTGLRLRICWQISMPGLVGQHDVEQHEVGVDAMEETERLVSVAGRLDREALAGQSRGQRLPVGLLVVDDEDERPVVPGRAGQRGPTGRRRCVCDCHAVFSLRQRRGGLEAT